MHHCSKEHYSVHGRANIHRSMRCCLAAPPPAPVPALCMPGSTSSSPPPPLYVLQQQELALQQDPGIPTKKQIHLGLKPYHTSASHSEWEELLGVRASLQPSHTHYYHGTHGCPVAPAPASFLVTGPAGLAGQQQQQQQQRQLQQLALQEAPAITK
eukprot:1159054-Pelagomonas_calceolata.AAC.18